MGEAQAREIAHGQPSEKTRGSASQRTAARRRLDVGSAATGRAIAQRRRRTRRLPPKPTRAATAAKAAADAAASLGAGPLDRFLSV
jgi:hypothetical protein